MIYAIAIMAGIDLALIAMTVCAKLGVSDEFTVRNGVAALAIGTVWTLALLVKRESRYDGTGGVRGR